MSRTTDQIAWHLRYRVLRDVAAKAQEVLSTAVIPSPHVAGAKRDLERIIKELDEELRR